MLLPSLLSVQQKAFFFFFSFFPFFAHRRLLSISPLGRSQAMRKPCAQLSPTVWDKLPLMLFLSYLCPTSYSSEVLQCDPQGSIADARGECRAQLSHGTARWPGALWLPRHACAWPVRSAGGEILLELGPWPRPWKLSTGTSARERIRAQALSTGQDAVKTMMSCEDDHFLSHAHPGPTWVCMPSPACPLPRSLPNHHLLASQLYLQLSLRGEGT